ncbi:ABC transporter permease [Cellulomonas sp. APG4]|uniref:ABC transporter permease n=1 Tax=Cellulomonas sp. APG4 TaxID=1538656 RepID=UPI00137B9157|nr:ABC transporter permease [Cellulomonas sp. APG4]NCT91320.1 ABC transporter permease [Cellulomonas sp. APG4]
MAHDTTPDWDAELQVYEPHKAGLPRFGPYFRDLVDRLPFAAEFSRSGIRAANTQTVFGQLWLVLNPLLLACVYYILVAILTRRGGMEFLAHIVGGLFVYYFVSNSISTGASSVTGGGRLIMNMAFPRLLMPMAAVRTAFFRFLPTVPVYLLIHTLGGGVWSPTMLLGLVFLGMLVVFGIGMAAFVAALQVYFRDTSSFLPYFLRIWLYLSPVLWYPQDAPERFADLMVLNPLYSMIGGWTETTLQGVVPPVEMWVAGSLWAVVALVAGSLFFMSRERDFAVRL